MNKNSIFVFIFFYFFYTVLYIIGPFKKDFEAGLIAIIIFLGSIFISFCSGYKLTRKFIRLPIPQYNKLTFKFLNIIVPIASIYSTYFYTGKFAETYTNLFLGVSNYFDYYRYSNLNNLSSFFVGKIPAILLYTLVKIYTFYVLYIFIFKKRNKFIILSLIISLLSQLHFSLSRGTTLEFFELGLFLLVVFSISPKTLKLSTKSKVYITFSLVFILFIFYTNIQFRISDNIYNSFLQNCTTSLCYNGNFLPDFIEPFVFVLNMYFSFGIIYLIEFLDFLNSNYSSWVYIPVNYFNTSIDKNFLCEMKIINCGVMWVPSFISYILNYSFLGFFFFLFIFGIYTSILVNSINFRIRFEFVILVFYNFYILVTLPIASLFSSSSNILIYAFCFFLIILNILGRNKN